MGVPRSGVGRSGEDKYKYLCDCRNLDDFTRSFIADINPLEGKEDFNFHTLVSLCLRHVDFIEPP